MQHSHSTITHHCLLNHVKLIIHKLLTRSERTEETRGSCSEATRRLAAMQNRSSKLRGVKWGKMRENKEQMREISGVTVDNSVRAAVTVPQGRCSQECRRRYVWCRPRTCPPCTSQSLLSLCGPRCRAAHYPALDPWEGRNATQVWITLIDTIFITVISYKRHDKSVSCLCRTQTEVNTGKPGHVMKQPTSLPVDDAFAVEEEEADRYLCCIKPGGREEEEKEGQRIS